MNLKRLNSKWQFNNFIKYYYQNTDQKISLNEFKEKYFMLNCSRQTRLLGRWVKLSKELNKNALVKLMVGREIEENISSNFTGKNTEVETLRVENISLSNKLKDRQIN